MLKYQDEYNAYWAQPDRWGSHSFPDPQTIIDQVLATCGLGKVAEVTADEMRLHRRQVPGGEISLGDSDGLVAEVGSVDLAHPA